MCPLAIASAQCRAHASPHPGSMLSCEKISDQSIRTRGGGMSDLCWRERARGRGQSDDVELALFDGSRSRILRPDELELAGAGHSHEKRNVRMARCAGV